MARAARGGAAAAGGQMIASARRYCGRGAWAGLAGAFLLAGCAAIVPDAGSPIVLQSDAPFPPQLESGLTRAVAAGDPLAIGALVGANPGFAVRIVGFAVTARPRQAAGIAAAAASAQPDLAPDLAAAAATANPSAAAEIAGRSAAAVPAARDRIGEAVIAALLPDERLAMGARIDAALVGARPPSVDDWALAASSKP
jgi:hypothetical protein